MVFAEKGRLARFPPLDHHCPFLKSYTEDNSEQTSFSVKIDFLALLRYVHVSPAAKHAFIGEKIGFKTLPPVDSYS